MQIIASQKDIDQEIKRRKKKGWVHTKTKKNHNKLTWPATGESVILPGVTSSYTSFRNGVKSLDRVEKGGKGDRLNDLEGPTETPQVETPEPETSPQEEPSAPAKRPRGRPKGTGRPALIPEGQEGYNENDDRHGTINGYRVGGCRCADCKEAVSSYIKNEGKCGTESGRVRHDRLGEQPCRKCRIAHQRFLEQTKGMTAKEKKNYFTVQLYDKSKPTASWRQRYSLEKSFWFGL